MALDNGEIIHYNTSVNGVWRSLVSRLVRVQEASGSNPDTPTKGRFLWNLPFSYMQNAEFSNLAFLLHTNMQLFSYGCLYVERLVPYYIQEVSYD